MDRLRERLLELEEDEEQELLRLRERLFGLRLGLTTGQVGLRERLLELEEDEDEDELLRLRERPLWPLP